MALEKFNVSKAEYNNLTGAASAVRRTRPKKITNTTGAPDEVARNVETDIYQKVIHDYMGENGVVTQLFGMELKQRADKQSQQWDLKEKEFYDLKQDWIQNVSYLKEVGTKRWENMAQEFGAKWKDWRADFKAEHEANQALFLNKIEQAVQNKETWTQNFLQASQNNAEEQSLREMYDSIAGMVQSMQENLPQGVSLSINVNDILASVLAKKPGSLSASLMDRASSIDTNFFLNEVKKYNFNDKGVKDQFKSLMEKTNVLSQNMVILQALESLRNMPESFVLAVKKQNEATQKSLDSTMAFGGFARMGAMYLRVIKNAAGGTEQQVLPVYNDFVYTPPTEFPLVKDSNGNEWDLSKTESLLDGKSNAPSPSDIGVMVRLAKNKMLNDFKKTLDVENYHNYELEQNLFDPEDLIGSFDGFVSSVQDGQNVSCASKSAKDCIELAANSGTLVGEVPGGAYGLWQFGQFYPILKTKKEMDKRKAMMDASRERFKGGIGRFYNQLGTIFEGGSEFVKGALKTVKSVSQGNFKDAGKQFESCLQGLMYAVTGIVDFVMFIGDLVSGILQFAGDKVTQLGRGTLPQVAKIGQGLGEIGKGLDQSLDEGYFELSRYRQSNQYQERNTTLGNRTGQEMYRNDKLTDNVITAGFVVTGIAMAVIAVIAAPETAGASLAALPAQEAALAGSYAAYKAARGAYEGGAGGMVAGAAEGYINYELQMATAGSLSVNLGYSYGNGYTVGMNATLPVMKTATGRAIGPSAMLNYNEHNGFSGGLGVRAGGVSAYYTEGYGLDEQGRKIRSHGWSVGAGGINLNYDSYQGYGVSLTYSQGFAGYGLAGAMSTTFSYTERGGLTNSLGIDLNALEGSNPGEYANIYNRLSQKNGMDTLGNNGLLFSILTGMGLAVNNKGRDELFYEELVNGIFGGDDGVAPTIKPGPRPGTYLDMEGNVLVRDSKTGNLVPEWMEHNLVLTDGNSYGTLDNIHPNNVPWYKSLMNRILGWIDPIKPIAAAFGKAKRAVLDNPTGLGTEDVEKAAAISADTRKIAASAKVAALLADAIESGDKYMLGNLNEFLELKTGQSNLLESVVKVGIESSKNAESMEIFSNLRPETIQKLNRMDWNDLAKQWSNFSGRDLNEIMGHSILPYRAKAINFGGMVLSGSWEYLEGANTTITIENATPQRFRYY
nr:hypothetical protein [Leptospira gomenensis]